MNIVLAFINNYRCCIDRCIDKNIDSSSDIDIDKDMDIDKDIDINIYELYNSLQSITFLSSQTGTI
jgi:hypothetical protein